MTDHMSDRERIGAIALRYGYIGNDRDNIVDIALAAMQPFKATVERLRSCQHACVPPCPHTRHFDEVTREVLP